MTTIKAKLGNLSTFSEGEVYTESSALSSNTRRIDFGPNEVRDIHPFGFNANLKEAHNVAVGAHPLRSIFKGLLTLGKLAFKTSVYLLAGYSAISLLQVIDIHNLPEQLANYDVKALFQKLNDALTNFGINVLKFFG